MPNVLDIEPVRALAKRASARIADEKIAARYARLAFDEVMNNPRSFRPAKPDELSNAPAWARQAHARGETVSVYATNRSIIARIHAVARRLADTGRVAAAERASRPDCASRIDDAREFLAKFNRVNFETAARKALDFSRLLSLWEEDVDTAPACAARTILLKNGRTWTRITTVSGLRAIGREFQNCLGRTTRTSGYGGMLRQNIAQYWVLRDTTGRGLIVTMAQAPDAVRFTEVKGPRNIPIHSDNADVAALARAIGMTPEPQPPPPSPSDQDVAALLRAARERVCRCDLCQGGLADFIRLRRAARAS